MPSTSCPAAACGRCEPPSRRGELRASAPAAHPPGRSHRRCSRRSNGSRDAAWATGRCAGYRAIASRSILRRDACAKGSSSALRTASLPAIHTSEATLHALCEVIERDQEAFWHARRQFSPRRTSSRLRLDSVTDPNCRWLLERCREAGSTSSYGTRRRKCRCPAFCALCSIATPRRSTRNAPRDPAVIPIDELHCRAR